MDALRDNNAELREQTAYLVCLCSSGLDQTLSSTMHCQDGLLLNMFDRHKSHIRSAHRFTDCFRICHVMLVGLHVWFDKLGWHKLDGMPKFTKLSRPVVCTTAGFHANQAGL